MKIQTDGTLAVSPYQGKPGRHPKDCTCTNHSGIQASLPLPWAGNLMLPPVAPPIGYIRMMANEYGSDHTNCEEDCCYICPCKRGFHCPSGSREDLTHSRIWWAIYDLKQFITSKIRG